MASCCDINNKEQQLRKTEVLVIRLRLDVPIKLCKDPPGLFKVVAGFALKSDIRFRKKIGVVIVIVSSINYNYYLLVSLYNNFCIYVSLFIVFYL